MDWIASEVLPSIRKTGSYSVNQIIRFINYIIKGDIYERFSFNQR